MIKKLLEPKDLGRVLNGLDQTALGNIAQAGLIIGVLKISIWISHVPGGSDNLFTFNDFNFDFYCWDDFKQYMHEAIEYLSFPNKQDKNKWEENVTKFGVKKRFSYCVCLALALERHLKNCSSSPNNAQKLAMEEIKKIPAGDLEISPLPLGKTGLGDKVDIYVTLHAASMPIIQLNISPKTTMNYSERLEGIFAYSIFSIIKISLSELNDPYKTLLEDLIFNENLTWQKELPRVGPPEKWNWLPKFAA